MYIFWMEELLYIIKLAIGDNLFILIRKHEIVFTLSVNVHKLSFYCL